MANEGEEVSKVDLLEMLPEGCIAAVVSHTTPVDACRLSLVASGFRSAAESDVVWESFLPSDYRQLVSRSVDHLPPFASKKELYLYLCNNHILIDGGTKSFQLDKRSGRQFYMIAARKLSIVWSDTPDYWRWTSHPESRFEEVVELVGVCWLEIHGTIDTCMLSPDTTYTAYLVFQLTKSASGFVREPAEVTVGVSGGKSEFRTIYLDIVGGWCRRNFTARMRTTSLFSYLPPRPRQTYQQYSRSRGDGWLEIELGEYFNTKGVDKELKMTLTEVKAGHWKSGLIVQGIEIRPKDIR